MLTMCLCSTVLSVETSFHHNCLCLFPQPPQPLLPAHLLPPLPLSSPHRPLLLLQLPPCLHTYPLTWILQMSPWSQDHWVNPRVCSTPPPGITLSGTSGRRATRRSASTESELLDKMCEQSDNSAQISYRLDRLLTSMEAQTNDRTAWAGWMSSAMLKIHEDLWPTYQMRSMDLLNQTIKESKLLSERDIQRQELDRQKQLDDRQKQLDDRQKQLDSMQQQMKVQQLQLQQQLIFQQPQPQQPYTITQMPPPPAPGPAALASSTPLPQGSDTQSQTTVIFQTPSGASTSGQSVGSSSSTSSTKFVITDTEGRTIGLSDLNLSDLNASFAGIPSVPSTPMTPMALLNQDDSQGS